MPIDEEEWNEGKLPSRLKPEIISYLKDNKSSAYTDIEILEYIQNFENESWGGFLNALGSLFPVQKAIKELVDEGKIESKMIESEGSGSLRYYKAK